MQHTSIFSLRYLQQSSTVISIQSYFYETFIVFIFTCCSQRQCNTFCFMHLSILSFSRVIHSLYFFSTTFKFASIPAHHCPLISRTHRAKGRARVKLLCSVSRSVFATISMYVRTVRTHLLYVSHSQRIIRLLYCLNISLGTHRCDK